MVQPRRKLEALFLALPALALSSRNAAGPALPATPFLLDAMPAGISREAAPPWYRVRDRAVWVIDLFERLERERRAQMQRAG